MQLLEPWIFLRLIAGLVATALLVRASFTAITVLRRFDVMRATEGQLALERRAELAATFVRVGAIAQALALVFSVLAADKLSRGIRGAMCAYGTFSSSTWGFRALAASVVVMLASGTVAQLFVFDARLQGMELARPLAWATVALAPLALIDLGLQVTFLTDLDLSVVASCCSVQLDPVAAARQGTASGPRVMAVVLAAIASVTCVTLALVSARRPRRRFAVMIGTIAALALPLIMGAVILEVAPYAFEVPQHHCPFCLFRPDAAGLGYPLFGAMFGGAIWLFAAGTSAIIAGAPALEDGWSAFASSRLRRGAIAWLVCGVVCAVPIARWAIVSRGGALFP